MTTSEIERLLTETLTEHAEEAMTQTDTQQELVKFEAAVTEGSRWRRPAVVVGALAAAAAVVVGLAVANAQRDENAVPPAAPVPTPSERAAIDFLTTYDGGDVDAVQALLAPDVFVHGTYAGFNGVAGLLRAVRWEAANGVSYVSVDCHDQGALSTGGVQVGCTLTQDAMGSERLGRGPWTGDVVIVTVENGLITDYSWTNGQRLDGFFEEMVTPFSDWVDATRPGDGDSMSAVADQHADRVAVRQGLALWTRNIDEYVAAVQAGEAE